MWKLGVISWFFYRGFAILLYGTNFKEKPPSCTFNCVSGFYGVVSKCGPRVLLSKKICILSCMCKINIKMMMHNNGAFTYSNIKNIVIVNKNNTCNLWNNYTIKSNSTLRIQFNNGLRGSASTLPRFRDICARSNWRFSGFRSDCRVPPTSSLFNVDSPF